MEQPSERAMIVPGADHRGPPSWTRKPGYEPHHDARHPLAADAAGYVVRPTAVIGGDGRDTGQTVFERVYTNTPAESTADDLVITPEQAGVCNYCQQPLSDGETHLHAGYTEPIAGAAKVTALRQAVRNYDVAMREAFTAYREGEGLAWAIYSEARRAVDERYQQAHAAAAACYAADLDQVQ